MTEINKAEWEIIVKEMADRRRRDYEESTRRNYLLNKDHPNGTKPATGSSPAACSQPPSGLTHTSADRNAGD